MVAHAKEKPLYEHAADIEDDFYLWCLEQAELLRMRRFVEADLPNIIEELASMGRQHRSKLKSSYRLLVMHLLKWQFQPLRRSRSRRITISRERASILDQEDDNLTLRNEASLLVAEVYRRAVHEASDETGLPVAIFPPDCPYTVDQLREVGWMPE